ncbi:hypothetical protein ACQ4M4_27080 [Leptolyngbya sp. AN02str]|uniref:hypothetical protein n=1 Tax=Leptolyngbya sp. AN02str TaxID=3423363 RepID=UPI003D32209D
MNLAIAEHTLHITLTGWERLLAFHVSSTIQVALQSVTHASTTTPTPTWREIRAPGTLLPGVIRAGTYYTERGREFWYVTHLQSCLTLDVADQYYKRIVLTVDEPEHWRDRIRSSIH